MVLGIVLIYATCFVSIKAGLQFAPPLLFGGLRALIGGTALLAVAAGSRQPLGLPRGVWWSVALLALLATTVSFGGMFLSPGRSGAGIASVLGNLQPLMVVVLAATLLGETLSSGKLLALGLGLAGVLLISSPELISPGAYGISGAAFAVASSFGTAAGSIIVKRIGDRVSLLALAGWQLVIGSLPLLIAGAIAEHRTIEWSGEFIALLLFLALAGTSLSSAVWYWLVRTADDVGRLTLFLYLIPVIGLALAFVVFGERLSVPEVAGVVLVIAGMALTWRMPEAAGGHHGAVSVDRTPLTAAAPVD